MTKDSLKQKTHATPLFMKFKLQTKIPVKWMAIESLMENKYTTKSDV